MKKSFILFNDSLEILDDLSDEQCGKLFRAIKAFNCGQNIELDVATKMLFLHFKNQFIRDNITYNEMVERQRKKGLKSAADKKSQPQSTKSTTVNNGQPLLTESTYTDTDTVTVTDTKKQIQIQDVISYFLEKGYSEFAASKFFNFYSVTGWKDSKGNKVKNWKQKAIGVWFKPENEISKQPQQAKSHLSEEDKQW